MNSGILPEFTTKVIFNIFIMDYSDSHTEFIHYPEDLKGLSYNFLINQINPQLINKTKPNLLFLAANLNSSDDGWARLLWIIKKYKKEISKNKWRLIKETADLKSDGIKVILHVENLEPIGNNLNRIDVLYKMGVRSIGLTHNQKNQFSGGCLSQNIGLTNLGYIACQKIINSRMILDLAHISKKGFFNVLNHFNIAPFISHTGIRSVFDNPRNIEDDILKMVNQKNGYVGIGFAGSFLGKNTAGVNEVKKQFEGAIRIVGQDKVGIGSDFGGITSFLPTDLESIEKVVNIDLLSNIKGDNLISYLENYWKVK